MKFLPLLSVLLYGSTFAQQTKTPEKFIQHKNKKNDVVLQAIDFTAKEVVDDVRAFFFVVYPVLGTPRLSHQAAIAFDYL